MEKSTLTQAAGPKIFGIGMPKTGTHSLAQALRMLGYKTWHGGSHIDQHGHGFLDSIMSRSRQYAEGSTSVNILAGCEKYDAMADYPVTEIYQQLDKQIPDAKFILTYRNPHDATLSMMRMCYPTWSDWGADAAARRGYSAMVDSHIEYLDGVFKYFWNQEDKFIVLDSARGKANWEMLCVFLGLDPKPHRRKDWPHVFDASSWFPERWQREGKQTRSNLDFNKADVER